MSESPLPRGQRSWARCRSTPTCFLEHFRGACMSVDTVSTRSHPPDKRVLKDFVTLHALPCNVGRLGRPRETPRPSQGPARASPRQAQVAAMSQWQHSAASVRSNKCRLLMRQSVMKESLSPQDSNPWLGQRGSSQGASQREDKRVSRHQARAATFIPNVGSVSQSCPTYK